VQIRSLNRAPRGVEESLKWGIRGKAPANRETKGKAPEAEQSFAFLIANTVLTLHIFLNFTHSGPGSHQVTDMGQPSSRPLNLPLICHAHPVNDSLSDI